MKKFKDKVAVITGAASGIGYGIAQRCVQEGMKVVLADIEAGALEQAADKLLGCNGKVLSVPTDVSKIDDVNALAQKTIDAFGAVHLLFNNAGVVRGGPIWKNSLADWEWIIGVNLWGLIHGVKVFVPIMLDQQTECHIVNTSSIAGLNSGSGSGLYRVTKHGIVAYSESLYHDLRAIKAKIGVSVLCPGSVNTRITESQRNRPSRLQNPKRKQNLTPEQADNLERFFRQVRNGMTPAQVADQVFEAIKENSFYIITPSKYIEAVKMRMEDIIQGRNPTLPDIELQ
jgi:NADP-dependent 3-hydroxy acid dehydrogenase YdfG